METITITISILALIISTSVAMWSWWRNRNIYAIEFFYCKPGEHNDPKKKSELKKKLESGKYTVLSSKFDSPFFIIVLGKIKK